MKVSFSNVTNVQEIRNGESNQNVSYVNNKNNNYSITNSNSNSPSFRAKPFDVNNYIKSIFPKSIEFLEKLEYFKGELGGILITALGTGLVAPISIGFNPFVKAPKGATEEQKEEVSNTKKYTAMRQPVSAALAIIFQASVLKPIDKFLNKFFNEADNSKYWSSMYDQSQLNSKMYIESLVQNDLKSQGIKKPSWFRGFVDGFKENNEKRANYNAQVKKLVEEKTNKQLDDLTKIFAKEGKILVNPEREVGKQFLDNKSVAELVNQQIDSYIAIAEKLKIDNKQLAFCKERSRILITNEEHLKNIFANVPTMQEFSAINPDDEIAIKKIEEKAEAVLNELLSKETNPDVKMLIQEVLDKPKDLRISKISRTLERIEKIKNICEGHYTPDKYIKALSQNNAIIDNRIAELILSKIKNVENADEQTIKEAIDKIAKACHFSEENALESSILKTTETFGTNKADLLSKINKDITKLYKEVLGRQYKGLNQIIKVIIGVFVTLPITCSALNWVYPRFMELCFPKLAGTKKDGGNK